MAAFSLFDPLAGREADSVALEQAIECWTPTALGAAHMHGFLWCRPGKGGAWKRRYAVCCANFVIWFAEAEAERPIKALGALCFEDLVVAPLEPPPMEREVALFGEYAFGLSPPAAEKLKGGNVFSGAAGRRYHFCAETDEEAQAWTMALMVWRHAALSDDRLELMRTRAELKRVQEKHIEQAAAAERELAEAREFARAQTTASEAKHAQLLQVQGELQHAHVHAACAYVAIRARICTCSGGERATRSTG